MMKNIINSPYRKIKILLILPVFAIVLYAFAKPDYRYKYVDDNSGNYTSGTSLLQKSVKGTVVQRDGKPLEGAAVILKGTTIGTISDVNGNFKLDNVPDDGLLVVTFVGFKSKVLKPVFTSDMTITLMRDTVKYMNLNIDTPPQPPPPPPPPPAINDVSNINTNDTPPPPPPSLSEKATEATSAVKKIPAVPQTEKEKYVVVESYPEFPGGKDAMATWITANIKYPAEAVKGKITGKVYVNFVVDKEGKVKNAVVSKSVSPLLDAEAVRVISSMPDWKPATQAGKPVEVQFKVPVEFKLK